MYAIAYQGPEVYSHDGQLCQTSELRYWQTKNLRGKKQNSQQINLWNDQGCQERLPVGE